MSSLRASATTSRRGGGRRRADVAIYDARKAELSAGRDARLPPEVSAALLRGDSLLKALRNWRDMTQQHLSLRTNLGQGYISDLDGRSSRRRGNA